jgi:hypothetical protein
VSAAPSPVDVLREVAFRIERGNPDPDELAALVVVLTALRARVATDDRAIEPSAPRATWDQSGNGYRSPLAWVTQGT